MYVDAIVQYSKELGLDATNMEFSRSELSRVSMKQRNTKWIPNWMRERRVAHNTFFVPEVVEKATGRFVERIELSPENTPPAKSTKKTPEDTVIVNLEVATRGDINKCLRNGICEIRYANSKGEEEKRFCTLKKYHVEDRKMDNWVDYDYEKNILVVWDMNGDEWRGGEWVQIPINKITRFEQLTGVPRT